MSKQPHKNVHAALAAAQASFGVVKKGETNGHFKNKYADLAEVVKAVVPALSAEGIAYFCTVEDGHMVTILAHGESETEMRCPVPLIVQKNDMQGFKSATTYARRIGLESITGVAPDDDDDGNQAAQHAPRGDSYHQPRQQQQPAGPSPEAVERAKDRLRACETLDALRDAFINLKAQQPLIAQRDDIYQLKENMKAALSVEHKEAAE